VLPLVVVLCLTACSKGSAATASAATASAATASPATAANAAAAGAAGQGAATPDQAAVKPVPAQLPEVIAKVNGDSITKAEFEKALNSIEQRAGGPVPPAERDRVYRGLLDQLVGYHLLIQESKTRKVTVPEADVDARIGAIRQQFPTEDAFKDVLAKQQMSVEQLKTDARQEMAIAKLITDEVTPKIAVKPEQVSDFYAKNPQHFQQGDKVRASHILISVPKDADAAAKAAARAKAEQILKDVKAGKDFGALAKANSQDPGSAVNGGDLGYFEQGQMVGPFNDVAFSLKPGAVSEVVETDFGFHVIKVVDKQAGRVVPIEEAKTKIEQFLQEQSREKETETFVNGLKAKSKVEIFI
jgi:peptidyl-prolyl cis-trans isomerase C